MVMLNAVADNDTGRAVTNDNIVGSTGASPRRHWYAKFHTVCDVRGRAGPVAGLRPQVTRRGTVM